MFIMLVTLSNGSKGYYTGINSLTGCVLVSDDISEAARIPSSRVEMCKRNFPKHNDVRSVVMLNTSDPDAGRL